MEIRDTNFGNDILRVSELLEQKTRGKSNPHICRSRIDQCVKRSKLSKGIFCKALLAEEKGKVIGFLYAEERNAFDLIPKMRFIEVHFLIGGNGAAVPLLKNLRELTNQRILIQNWGMISGRMKPFKRLIGALDPQQVAVTYQI